MKFSSTKKKNIFFWKVFHVLKAIHSPIKSVAQAAIEHTNEPDVKAHHHANK